MTEIEIEIMETIEEQRYLRRKLEELLKAARERRRIKRHSRRFKRHRRYAW